MSRLERAIGNATSFAGASPPESCREIGRVERGSMGTVIYYESEKDENFYYITEAGLEFARRMAALQKKTKK